MMGLKKRIRTIGLLLFFSFILVNSSYGLLSRGIDFYADLEITVEREGYVTIDGISNYPDLIVENTEEYTSKQQSLWTLAILKNETFSDFIFIITFPEQTTIQSIESSATTVIGEKNGHLTLTGYGSNKSLSITVDYQTEKISEESGFYGLDTISFILIVSIIFLIFSLIIIFLLDKKKLTLFKKNNLEFSQNQLRGLNERQKKILALLQESKIAMTQTDIQRELDMPKASVSRNIRRLELKGLVEKERIGMSNLIRLKKP